jgi:hypothetical protein
MSVSKAKLKKLGTNWKKATEREASGDYENLEPGIYLCAITGAELGEFADKIKIKWDFTVQEGESAGQVQSDFDQLESEDNQYWVQQKLLKLGYELPEDISDLPEILADIAASKPILRCKVVEKDGYINLYMNKVVSEDGGETAAEIKGDPEPEEKPAKSKKAKKPAVAAEEQEGVEFEDGDKVAFTDEGTAYTGTITALNDDSADVQVDDVDEVWDVELTDLTKLEEGEAEAPKPKAKKKGGKKKAAAAEEVDFDVGATVTFETEDETELEGDVTAVDGEDRTVVTEGYEDDEHNGEWELEVSDLTAAAE